MPLTFEITSEPDADDLAQVGNALSAFNDADVGPSERTPLAVLVREEYDLVAGLSGYTAWGWLYVQWLWVSEAARGRRLARKMLARVEDEAISRGCHGAWIDTFNPVALKAYGEAGYTPFGALDDFPHGRTRTFLSKRLTP